MPKPEQPQALARRPKRGRQWWRALVALGRLARNTEDTTQVFEILQALNGDCLTRTHDRMLRRPEGRGILANRPSLLPRLCDRTYLEGLPQGTLGHAYLHFMIAGSLTADGLFEARDNAETNSSFAEETDPTLQYVGERLIEMHDLWHVLTGYGRDDTGELANLWFSYGQFGQLGMAFIAFMGTLDGPFGLSFLRYMRAAYRRGRRAKLLVAQPIEDLLALPLDEARKTLDIETPLRVHPLGIRTGNRQREGIGRGAVALAS